MRSVNGGVLMTLGATCTSCGKAYRNIPARFAGKSIRCKACGEAIHVPAEEDFEAGFLSDVAEAAALPPIVRQAPLANAPRTATRPQRRTGRGRSLMWLGVTAAFAAGAAVMVILGIVLWEMAQPHLVERDMERFARTNVEFKERFVRLLEGATDASSAAAAVAEFDGPLREFHDDHVEHGTKLLRKLDTLPAAEQMEFAKRFLEINEPYQSRLDELNPRFEVAIERLLTAPPDVRAPIGGALRRFLHHVKMKAIPLQRLASGDRSERVARRLESDLKLDLMLMMLEEGPDSPGVRHRMRRGTVEFPTGFGTTVPHTAPSPANASTAAPGERPDDVPFSR